MAFVIVLPNVQRKTVLVRDTFNRADNASSLGSADSGQAWSVAAGTWGISSNTAYSSTVGVAAAVVNARKANGVLRCTAARPASNTGFYVRCNSAGSNGYRIRADGTNLYLEEMFNANNIGAQTAQGWAGAQTIKVRALGSLIEVYLGDVLKLTYTETVPQTGTYWGIWKNSAQTTGAYYEDFSVRRS